MISENKKVTVAIAFVLILTLSLLIAYEKIVDPSHVNDRKREQVLRLDGYMTPQDLFSSNFSNTTAVFLIGSSHLGFVNVTSINQLVSSNIKDSSDPVTVYNLAAFGDRPAIRLNSIDEIISTSPKIIFYEVSYRDFEFTYEYSKNIIPLDFKEIFSSHLYQFLFNVVPVNPQELLFSILRPIQNSLFPSLDEPIITNDKTPFFHYTDFQIKSQDELKSEISPVTDWENPNIAKENFDALKQIIERSDKKGVKVVIFTSPLHEYYLEKLSEKQKKDFADVLKELEDDYKLKIYDFENKYAGLDVWRNISHISPNNTVTVYNEDIAKMIIAELNSEET